MAYAQLDHSSQVVAFVDRIAIVCPALETDVTPPKKSSDVCLEKELSTVDPQSAHVWVLLNINIPDVMLDSYEPLGLGISAKASSYAYINGREVARNGRPAFNESTEVIGRMDVMFPLREGVLKSGVNEIALRFSSHSGYLSLDVPIHNVYISAYEKPQSRILRRYASTLFPFGVFVLGALYFVTMSVVGRIPLRSTLLAFMSVTIASQLFAEVSRGLFAYEYPVHDIRLIVIVACSALFSMALSIYVALVFGHAHLSRWLGLIVMTSVFALFMPSGFDAKALLLLLSQTMLSLVIALFYWREALGKSAAFVTVLFVFAVVNIFSQGQFLDVYFFYGIAVLMLFLFVQQALAYGQEQALRQEENVRANKLQLILDQQKTTNQPEMITLSESGKVHRVSTDDIVSISGADDYIEVKMKSGKSRLISSTLTEMETKLPSVFLRVHRSHIVNTKFIESFTREPSGTGLLTLEKGGTVPVSRRIMPSVRKALT